MIILDNSFLIAYYNEDDVFHNKALKIIAELESGKYGIMLVSDFIFDEFISVMLRLTGEIKKVTEHGDDLRYFAKMTRINEDIFEEAWNIFRIQKKTKLSFTDCTIVALMKIRRIKYLASFDEDFKKVEGIEVLS